jgi:hypothetical protein
VVAVRRQRTGGRFADAGGCAGDDGDTSLAVAVSHAAQASGIGMPKASRVMSAGSGPPRLPVSSASDRRQLVSGELEVEHVEVLGDAVSLGRLRDGRATLLQVPAEHDLRRALGVRLGDPEDDPVLERAGVRATLAVEGDAADGRPSLGQDAVLSVQRLDLALLEVGCSSIWFTAGMTLALASSLVRWSTMKLLTPMARTLPSSRSCSSAR